MRCLFPTFLVAARSSCHFKRAATQPIAFSAFHQFRYSSAQGQTLSFASHRHQENTGSTPTFTPTPSKMQQKHDKDATTRGDSAKIPSKEVIKQFEAESCYGDGKATLSIVVVGASGDLAKKMTFPALFDLFANNLIPINAIIIGYARSKMSDDECRESLKPNLEEMLHGIKCGKEKLKSFLKRIRYVRGGSDEEDMENLVGKMAEWEREEGGDEEASNNRMYYFAIPPSVFLDTAASIKAKGVSESGWTRLIVEKPFGHDFDSAEQLASDLGDSFSEAYMYRIDHYLGEEMVQTLLTMRFGNMMFEPIWNKEHIESVTFDFKEDFGTEGRGGYFDEYGIHRDVIQNHLLQVFAMVAMEPPVSISGENSGTHIRDEKLKVLRSVAPIKMEDVVLGQYTANEELDKIGYTDADDVRDDSKTATFCALVVLKVRNRRWGGVPFIFRAGEAMDEHKVEVRIKFKNIPGGCKMFGCDETPRNELIFQLEPEQGIRMKFNIKQPGLRTMPMQSDLDLSYQGKFHSVYTPEAYVRLLLEVIRGKQATFVRRDEVLEAWRIFTPMLENVEKANNNGGEVDGVGVPLHKYKYGVLEDFMLGPDSVRDC